MDRIKKFKLGNRRSIAMLGLIVILIVIVIGIFIANLQSHSYQTSVKKWNDSLRSHSSSNNLPSFSKKIVIGNLETAEQSEAQKLDCSANTQRLNWFEEHSTAPTVGFNPFGILSGNYREALKKQDTERQTEKGVRQSVAAMDEYQDMCEYYIKAVDIAKKRIQETEAAKQYKTYEGTDQQQNQSCAIDGCLPEDKTLWPKLADIYKGHITSAKSYAELYRNNCFSETYKKVCELNARYFDQKAINQEKYNDAIRKGSAAYAGINSRLDKRYDPLIKAAYLEVKGTILPKSGDPESSVQKNLMETIEKKIESNLKKLREL